MASKNLLPVAALCSALVAGMPVAALATPAMDFSLPTADRLATDQMSVIACTGSHLDLGVPPSPRKRLDSRGYRALAQDGRPLNGMCHLHMARSCN